MGALLAASLLAATPAGAATPGPEAPPAELTPIEDTSLEDLLDMPTDAAAQVATRLRTSPGMVTVITRDEIIASGARDLVDILNLVPGFVVEQDVEGVLGIGLRGLWAHEGKVLLLFDGHEMNERLYNVIAVGGHFPMENVQRVEIVRGPGSVNYGGFAELGVINIVTRGAADFEGLTGTAAWGQLESARGRRGTFSLGFGDRVGDLDASVSLAGGVGVQSDGVYRTYYGDSYQLGPRTAAETPLLASVKVDYQGVQLRYLYDGFSTTNRSGYGDELTPFAIPVRFTGHYASIAYGLDLFDGALVITPKLEAKIVKPWQQDKAIDVDAYPSAGFTFTDYTARLWRGSVLASWTVPWQLPLVNRLNILGGFEAYLDEALVDDVGPTGITFRDGSLSSSFTNVGAFAQGLWESPWFTLTAGLRFENHSFAGPSLVPRVSLTTQLGDFHAKALFAQGFRSPGIEQVEAGVLEEPMGSADLPRGIHPELSTVIEGEVGYQVSDFLFASANYFEMWIDNPIVYTFDADLQQEFYYNENVTGSRGVEAEVRLQLPFITARANYSLALISRNTVDTFAIPGHGDQLLGFPQHKASFHGTLSAGRITDVLRGLTIDSSLVFLSERYAVQAVTDAGDPVYGPEAPAVLLNAFVRYEVPWVSGLDVAMGVYNLLDWEYRYVQPYNGGHAPFPAKGREWIVKLGYSVPM